MKRPHPRKIATIALYSVIGLIVAGWIGIYVSWRTHSVAYNLGKPGIFRQVSPANPISENYLKLFAPLAKVDGWISGETVYVDRPIFVSLRRGNLYPDPPDLPPWAELSFGDDLRPMQDDGKNALLKP